MLMAKDEYVDTLLQDCVLAHCALVTPYDDVHMSQHWLRELLIAGRSKLLPKPMLTSRWITYKRYSAFCHPRGMISTSFATSLLRDYANMCLCFLKRGLLIFTLNILIYSSSLCVKFYSDAILASSSYHGRDRCYIYKCPLHFPHSKMYMSKERLC